MKTKICGLFIFFLIMNCTGFSADVTVPQKIAVAPFKSAKQAEAYLFEETIRTIISSSTNLNLILNYQITNYLEWSDSEKFIQINKIHGLISGEFSAQNGKYILTLTTVDRDRKKNTYKKEFGSIDEGLGLVRADFLNWAENNFPRLPQKVILQEEVEKVSIGKFEYTKPVILLEAGGIYIGSMMMWQTTANASVVPIPGGYLDASYRYSWYGFNAGGYFMQNGFSFYAGPQLNLLQGLITLTLRTGYQKLNFRGNTTSYDSNLIIHYQAGTENYFLGFTLLSHVSDKYLIEVGGEMSPIPTMSVANYKTDTGGLNDLAHEPMSIWGFSLKNYFGITSDLFLTLQYRMNIFLPINPMFSGTPFLVNSMIYGGLQYQFNLGGK